MYVRIYVCICMYVRMYVPAVVMPSEGSKCFSAHHALVDIIVYNPAHPFEDNFIRTRLAIV